MNQVTTQSSLEQDATSLLEAAYQHQPSEALALAFKALKCAEPALKGQVFLFIGQIYYQQANLQEALTHFQEAYQWLNNSKNVLALDALLALGRVQRDLGSFEAAEDTLLHLLERAQDLSDPVYEVDAMNLLAGIYDAQGKTAQSLKFLQDSYVLATQHQLNDQLANILNNMGSLYTSLGNYPQALECLYKANHFIQENNPKSRSESVNLIKLGQLYQDMGDLKNAFDFFTQAYELGKTIQDAAIEITALNNLANLHLKNRDWQSARDGFELALAISQKSGLKQFEIDNLDGLGQVYLALGQPQLAVKHHLKALEIASSIGDSQGELDALLNLGLDYTESGQYQEALKVLTRSLEVSQDDKSSYLAHERLSLVYEKLGDISKSLFHYKHFHQLQHTFFNAENQRKTRELSVQFEVDRIHRQAQEYRLRTDIERQAREVAERTVQERTKDLEEAQLEIVTRLAIAGEYRDDDTGEHTRRVGRNAALLAFLLGWSEEDVQTIYSAARLHDVGKIGVRDAILLKPGKLTQDEMVIMKTHTTKGAGILTGGHSKLLKMAEEIAHYHHERWDGNGYPHGLAGLAIPQSARIVAVADVLDALIHERPYKKAWGIADALKEIARLSGSHFDPLVVEMCLRAFQDNPLFSPLDSHNDWSSTQKSLRYLLKTPINL